jgi:hypothetical protein
MHAALLAICLLGQPSAEPDSPTVESGAVSASDALRKAYFEDAAKYEFQRADDKQDLRLNKKPIMRWANDDDWSGDVFVWTDGNRPAVIGCILSGPGGTTNRLVFHEFHLIGEHPIAPATMLTKRRWQPQQGLATQAIAEAPAPADTAKARTSQMRVLARRFAAKMDADGEWDLRLLTQPLHRYADEANGVIDGALFAYVWTKGTDPEVILLLESRKTETGVAWQYAPVRFSNRKVWLQLDGKEVWRVDSHQEPADASELLYTTAYARTMPTQSPADTAEEPGLPNNGSR